MYEVAIEGKLDGDTLNRHCKYFEDKLTYLFFFSIFPLQGDQSKKECNSDDAEVFAEGQPTVA